MNGQPSPTADRGAGSASRRNARLLDQTTGNSEEGKEVSVSSGFQSGSFRVRLEQRLQLGEVLAVRATHRRFHDRGHHLGEPGRFTTVAQRHSRRTVALGSPRICGLHRKRALLRSHHQTLAGNQIHELVRVPQRTAEKPGNELDLRADPNRRRRLPLDRVDVGIPIRSVRRVSRKGRDDVGRPGDDDLGFDVNVDALTLLGPDERPSRVDLQLQSSSEGGARAGMPSVGLVCRKTQGLCRHVVSRTPAPAGTRDSGRLRKVPG